MLTRLIGKEDHAPGIQFQVIAIEIPLIPRREEVSHTAARSEPQEGVADIRAAAVAVERAIAGGKEEVSCRINREAAATLPDAAPFSIGRRRVYEHALQRGGVVS